MAFPPSLRSQRLMLEEELPQIGDLDAGMVRNLLDKTVSFVNPQTPHPTSRIPLATPPCSLNPRDPEREMDQRHRANSPQQPPA
ncbi:hypothetical protein AOQ84DRAFT_226738, partial [Glonium stellatum]